MSQRVDCEHAHAQPRACGGCPLLDRPYDEQLAHKHARVAEALGRYPSLAAVAVPPLEAADPIVGYRTRAKLMVGEGGAIGLFARGGGHEVVDGPRCRVLSPALAAVAGAIRERARRAAATGGALAPFEGSPAGSLRAVDLREVRAAGAESARVLVTWVVDRSRAPRLDALRAAAEELMAALPAVVGVAVNYHQGSAPQVLGAETVPLAGASRAGDRVGASLQFATFGSFVQAHRGQTARVHALLAGAVGRGRVLDLYGGSGAIGLALASAGARVTIVESFAPAVEQARAAAAEQGLDVDAMCADAAEALARLPAGERVDAVIVNPPRRGTSPRVREALARARPAVIAYVSCEPSTLARDLAHLANLGYRTAAVQPLDMIPLTEEVETVAVLRPGSIPAPAVIYEDEEILAVDKAPHEPTVPQGEYAGSLLARVRLLPGAANAVPLQRAEVATSGAVLFARRAAVVARWEAALAAGPASAVHLVLARGVTSSKGRAGGIKYRRLAVAAGHSLLETTAAFDPRRAPGLRKALAAIGHPVLGDDRHGHPASNRHLEEKLGLDRAFVHASRLELVRPGGEPLIVEVPLAGDLRSVLARGGCSAPPQTRTAPPCTGRVSASRVRA